MMRRAIGRRVGVIMGGSTPSRDQSVSAGHAIAEALSARGHDVVRISLGDGFGPDLAAAIQRARVDAAFLALSGRLGEDGCVQGMLELARIPYTGSSVLASALAMDKLKAKEMFRLHNVPTPPYYTIAEGDDRSDLAALHGSFGFPAIVKPRGEGGSLGVTRVTNLAELERALEEAFHFDDTALVERFVTGMEVRVALLNGQVLGSMDVVTPPAMRGESGATTVALSPQRARGVQNLAERAARALGCTGAVQVDVLVTPGENEYVLEVNTLPALSPESFIAQAAAEKGYDFADLCEVLLTGAKLAQPARRKAKVEHAGFRQTNGAIAPVVMMKSVG